MKTMKQLSKILQRVAGALVLSGIALCPSAGFAASPTVYVTNTSNSGPGSLREAILQVDPGGVILFNLNLPATIYLSQELIIDKNLTINGPVNGDVWITGGNSCRILNILDYCEVHLSNINLVNGYAWYWYWGRNGGGIYCGYYTHGSMENVRITNCTGRYGGGIYFNENYGLAWELNNVVVESCTANSDGGGIYAYGQVSLSGSVIRNNTAMRNGGGIYNTQMVTFDQAHRNSVYSNKAQLGPDLFGGNIDMIRLKKFTVSQPNDYFAYPQEAFSGFEIQLAVLSQLDQDVYVSPTGSDANTGKSASSPFKTIGHALAMTISDPDHPNTIHLAAGEYSLYTNGEYYPLYANSHVYLQGEGTATFLQCEYQSPVSCIKDVDFQLNNMTLDFGSSLYIDHAEISLSDFVIENCGGSDLLFCTDSRLELSNGIIRDNHAYSYGAILQTQGSSDLLMTDINISGNNGQVMRLDAGSSASLTGCLVEGNFASTNNLIDVLGYSSLSLVGTTIRNNQVDQATLVFSGSATVNFDPENRSNIFDNLPGRDLQATDHTGSKLQIILDTFSVAHPTNYYALPCRHFDFDILNGANKQISQDLYISPDGSDENTGTTPEDPFRTFTKAFRVFYPSENTSNIIHLAEGTYGEDEYFPIYPTDALMIEGAGQDLTVIQVPATYSLAAPVMEIFQNSGLTLRNLSIRNNRPYPGLEVEDSEFYLDHCNVSSYGIGINISGGTVKIYGEQASISGGRADGIRGTDAKIYLQELLIEGHDYSGIDINNCSLEGYDLVIENNEDGGVSANNSQVSIKNSVIIGNTGYNGAGLKLVNSGGMLINSIVENNTASDNGGGMYFSSSGRLTFTLVNSTLRNNKAQTGGGISYFGDLYELQLLSLNGTSILNNTSENNGGGLYLSKVNPLFVGCRIEQNEALAGGGIFFENCDGKSPFLSSTTITRNKAVKGGGIGFCNNDGLDIRWDPVNRCNIFMNLATDAGQDLQAEVEGNDVYPVVVDTFTVACPCEHFACSLCSFDFDILNGYAIPGDIDIYLSPEGDDLNSGFSADDPMKTLAMAAYKFCLDTLAPHKVHLAEGVYSPTGTGETFPVDLWGSMEITGQGPDLTVVHGEFSHQLFTSDDDQTDILRNMTLTGGHAGANKYGGAIYKTGGSLILENLVIDTNFAVTGGGVCAMSSDLIMDEVTLSRNRASGNGGGIYCYAGKLDLSDVSLSENHALKGGGVYTDNVEANWEDVIFLENEATYGGGIYIMHDFSNHARNTLFKGNTAFARGGGLYLMQSDATLRDVSVTGNKSKYGAGVSIQYSEAELMNLCIAGNEAIREGSALYSAYTDIVLNHLTIAGNLPATGTSNIYIWGQAATMHNKAVIDNSLIWGNNENILKLGAVDLTVEYCDVQYGRDIVETTYGNVHWMHGNKDIDPQFLMMGDHPYMLSDESPCIDAARPPVPGQKQYPFDLLGHERNVDGDGDGRCVEDIGAYEFQGILTPKAEVVVPGSEFRIGVNPNPVVDRATITFSHETEANIMIDLFNAQGNHLERITSQRYAAGSHEIQWNAAGLAPGIYFLRMTANGESQVVKLVRR